MCMYEIFVSILPPSMKHQISAEVTMKPSILHRKPEAYLRSSEDVFVLTLIMI